ncbi:hypothetical protein [Tiger frog virus]|uniref:Uncharacterized protein n=2 Tax=Rana tigrina ranavirus TaxID=160691 RepID=A0A6M8PGR0_RTRV|nr:hypothetical protein [Tiger frog virus]
MSRFFLLPFTGQCLRCKLVKTRQNPNHHSICAETKTMANTQNSVMDFVDTNVIEVVRGQGLYHVILEKATELAIPDEYILEAFFTLIPTSIR